MVSIQMCCYNGEKHLKAAIDSILRQSYAKWELIFWDNQSSDRSAEIVQSYNDDRIKYHFAPVHTDLGGARALSWPLLRGDYIAFLDVDDTWEPEKLALQVALFADPQTSIVAGDVMWFSAKKTKLIYNNAFPPEGYVTGALLRHYFLSLPSVMVRRKAVEMTGGGFDPDFSHNADFDLFIRASTTGKLAIVKQHVASWRVEMSSQSWAKRSAFEAEHFRLVTKYRNTPWVRQHKISFWQYQLIIVVKKLYFALVNGKYEKNQVDGLLKYLDRLGWLGFCLVRSTPVRQWIQRHYQRHIKKWA